MANIRDRRALSWGAAAILLAVCAAADDHGLWRSSGDSSSEHHERRERPARNQGAGAKAPASGQMFSGSLPEHARIARNQAVVQDIRSSRRKDSVAGRYYRHAAGGARYWHYQAQGVHWYGFYSGPRFYWTRWHKGFWWHYDPASARWAYWWGSRWWSPGAAGGAALAAVLGAFFAAARISRSYAVTAESPYLERPVVVWPATEKMTRKIPLGVLKDAPGLRVGVQLRSSLASGREFVSTVTAIGKDDMTVAYSWEFVRWSRGGAAGEAGMAPQR